jgi:hypothetical protein
MQRCTSAPAFCLEGFWRGEILSNTIERDTITNTPKGDQFKPVKRCHQAAIFWP